MKGRYFDDKTESDLRSCGEALRESREDKVKLRGYSRKLS